MTSGDVVGWLIWWFGEKRPFISDIFYCGPLLFVFFLYMVKLCSVEEEFLTCAFDRPTYACKCHMYL